MFAFCLSITLSTLLYSADDVNLPSLYSFSGEEVQIYSVNNEIKTYLDIASYLEKIYQIDFEINRMNFNDINKDIITFLRINIITNKELHEIFNNEMHSSYLIIDIGLNFLQPKVSRHDWPIHGLIISLNGIFLDFLDYDITYPSILTPTMMQDIIER
jgi:hypothetical protein